MIRFLLLCLGFMVAVFGVSHAKAEDVPNQACCRFDATLRVLSDKVHYHKNPLLPPGVQNGKIQQTQARLELSAHGPVDQPDAPLSWYVKGYVRTDESFDLSSRDSSAFLKIRQATVSVPIFEGDITFGRITLGSGTLRLRNLTDYMDGISSRTERRGDFLPERLENRIGQAGIQLSQWIDSIGTLHWLFVPKINGLSDSNHEKLSLLRFSPEFQGSSVSLEILWFLSGQRTALGAQGTIPLGSDMQIYGEFSHERHWPQLKRAEAARNVRATLVGVGLEYLPHADWTISMEAIKNNRPASPDAFAVSSRNIGTPDFSGTRNMPIQGEFSYGYQQPWYIGALTRYQPNGSKLAVSLSYYRGLRDGSSTATLQTKFDLSKHVEISLFVRALSARAGQEFWRISEKARYGLALNWVM